MTPMEEELLEVLQEIQHYLTQRVLSMTDYNHLLLKVDKAIKKARKCSA